MSTIVRNSVLRYGVHASNTDLTTTPGTLYFVRNMNPDAIVRPSKLYETVAREWQVEGNESLPALRGKKGVAVPDIELGLYGLSGSGAGNGVNTSSLGTCTSALLSTILGAAVVDTVGDTTAASPGTGTTVTMDGAYGGTVGGGLLIYTNTGLTYQARQIVAISGADVTIDRALTQMDGTADTPNESEVVYGGRAFPIDPASTNPTHFYLNGETFGVDQYIMFGCMAGASLNMPSGGHVSLVLSNIGCTNWTESAGGSPAYSEPIRGSNIVVTGSPLWIGATLYQAYDLSIDFGIDIAPRRSDGGTNGNFGYVVKRRRPVLSGKLRAGTLTAPAEATRALQGTWNGAYPYSAPTFDVAVQVGTQPTAAMYFRISAARLEITPSVDNGQEVFSFTATTTKTAATGASEGAYLILF